MERRAQLLSRGDRAPAKGGHLSPLIRCLGCILRRLPADGRELGPNLQLPPQALILDYLIDEWIGPPGAPVSRCTVAWTIGTKYLLHSGTSSVPFGARPVLFTVRALCFSGAHGERTPACVASPRARFSSRWRRASTIAESNMS